MKNVKTVAGVHTGNLKNIRKRQNEKGITLIALVITIIVLLILAGITIATLTGENGLFARAKEAKEKAENSQQLENDILKDYENKIDEYLNDSTLKIKFADGIEKNTEILTNTSYTINSTDIINEDNGNLKVTINGQEQSLPYNIPTSKVESYKIIYTVEKDGKTASLERVVKVYNNYLATNLIPNSNFTNGATGWILQNESQGKMSVNDGILTFESPIGMSWHGFGTSQAIIKAGSTGHKYFSLIRAKVPTENYVFGLAIKPGGANAYVAEKINYSNNEFTNTGAIFEANQENGYFAFYNKVASQTKELSYVDYCMLIDLTQSFGKGNEPDLEWCNSNIEYFENSKTIKYIKDIK